MAQLKSSTSGVTSIANELTVTSASTVSGNLYVSGEIIKGSTNVISNTNTQVNTCQTLANERLKWHYVGYTTANNAGKVFTVSNLSSYKELLIMVGVSSAPLRVLASEVMRMDHILYNTTHIDGGTNQTSYTSNGTSYGAGVSYIGNNQLRIRTTTNASGYVYVR